MSNKQSPAVLVIMDGMGVSHTLKGNAILSAKTPNLDHLWTGYRHGYLKNSGQEVGLDWGTMGNSEIGHLNLGSGRVVYQGMEYANKLLESEAGANSPIWTQLSEHLQKTGGDLHLMGLISSGGVHADLEQVRKILEILKTHKFKGQIWIHGFTDGRDMPVKSAQTLLENLEKIIKKVGVGKLATLVGRFYAMDRDHNWERTRVAYDLLTEGNGKSVKNFEAAVKDSYANSKTDEFFEAYILNNGKDDCKIKNGAGILFFNFRPDRARQLTHAFVDEKFEGWERTKINDLFFVSLTEYEKGLPVAVLAPQENVKNTLAEVISLAGLSQLHIAETEKYAHVTFFFNGKREEPFAGEERIIIPSPKVKSYAEKPEMMAREVTEEILKGVAGDKYDFILVNYANGDMVGHTGDLSAAIKAVEVVDECVGKISQAVLAKQGHLLITADHGNCEEMVNLLSGLPLAEHSQNGVPYILAGQETAYRLGEIIETGEGVLADVAPTILNWLKLKTPPEMTGSSLLGR